MIKIGFDIGGTKIAAIALDQQGREVGRSRVDVPRDFAGTVAALVALAQQLVRNHGAAGSIGIGMPGVITAEGEVLRAVNLTWLEDRPLRAELAAALGKPIRIANDANCFALSEAVDGAGAGALVVFGVTLGTGVGGGIVVDGRPLVGAGAIAGEWGHNPLPVETDDLPPVRCGCGRLGCIESWLNGAALPRYYEAQSGAQVTGTEVVARATAGDPDAIAAIERYRSYLATALAGVINLLDPDVIVLGGGASAIPGLETEIPKLWGPLIVAPKPGTRLVYARHGPESGLRGAAWLGERHQTA